VIPYRTEVIIDGHTYKAQDCGGAIKGNRIDVYFNNHQEALNFGVQYKEVFVKSENKY
jgi:3D (Asp-Asp-Asp) domain-containing protein